VFFEKVPLPGTKALFDDVVDVYAANLHALATAIFRSTRSRRRAPRQDPSRRAPRAATIRMSLIGRYINFIEPDRAAPTRKDGDRRTHVPRQRDGQVDGFRGL
jgi:hypothetical protein